jgi:hypothetical protein
LAFRRGGRTDRWLRRFRQTYLSTDRWLRRFRQTYLSFDSQFEQRAFHAEDGGCAGTRCWHFSPSLRLALVTLFQFLDNLSDRQAVEAVRGRVGPKFE